MPIAQQIARMVEAATMIKTMFEEGARLKAAHGAQNVFDFSLGNPDVPPPPQFKQVLKDLIDDASVNHGYTPTPGLASVRQAVADYLSTEYGTALSQESIVMTVGASGALNDVFKTLLNPGEQILVPAPYFVGYNNYAVMAGAVLKSVPTTADFHLDPAAIEAAITEKTRLLLINSPNNPTGAVYSKSELDELGAVLERTSARFGRRIYLVSDEPYRKIVYEAEVPSVFQAYPHTIVVNSYSKELSLAGERIGYLAIHPEAEDAGLIAGASGFINSMLCVNAPALMQQAVARLQGVTVDVSIYQRRRDMLCEGLADAGYEFSVPRGAFYLFPKSPLADDMAFVNLLKEELILAVPGVGFGAPGYFRLSYAVPDATISGSFKGFQRALEKL